MTKVTCGFSADSAQFLAFKLTLISKSVGDKYVQPKGVEEFILSRIEVERSKRERGENKPMEYTIATPATSPESQSEQKLGRNKRIPKFNVSSENVSTRK